MFDYWNKLFLKFLAVVFFSAVVAIAGFAGVYAWFYGNVPNSFQVTSVPVQPPFSQPELDFYDFAYLSVGIWTGQPTDQIVPASQETRVIAALEQLLGILAFVFILAAATRVPLQST